MKYGRAIRICRAAKAMSQKDLASKAGIAPSHISLIEAGKRFPSLEATERICKALDVPTHLVMLLAAESEDVQGKHLENLKDLSGTLLQLLTSAPSPKRKYGRKHASS